MSADRGSGPRVRHTVLVVEDDDGIRDALVQILEESGFRPVAVTTIAAAIEACAETPPNVVVADFNLPDGEATTLLASPVVASVATVIVSASIAAREAAEKHGVAFVAKPFDLDELTSIVRSLVEARAVAL